VGPHLDVWYGTVPNGEMEISVRRREPAKAGGDGKLQGGAKKVLYLL